MESVHCLNCPISFGDCDPAGIVFYPNVYAWFDRTFHDWLRGFGGHAMLCRQLKAVGIGVLEANAQFRRPMREEDVLSLALSVQWGRKTLHLSYEGHVGDRVTVVGAEVRGLFKLSDTGMVAAEIEALRNIMEANG